MCANRVDHTFACLLAINVVALPANALADVCEVPTQRPTIQEAVDDPLCTDIVLLAQTYQESVTIDRSLLMFGPETGGAIVRGVMLVEGASVLAMLADFDIQNGCPQQGLAASMSAEIQAEGVQVTSSSQFACGPSDVIFLNGFEF